MKLARAHAVGMSASGFLCGLCVAQGSGFAPVSSGLAVLAAVGAALAKAGRLTWLAPPARAATMAVAIALFAVLGGRQGAWGLQDAAHAAMALLAARLMSARLPNHDGQALLVMATLVCAATVLSPSAWLAPFVLAFVVVLTNTMVTRQLLFDAHMQAFRTGDADTLTHVLQRADVMTARTIVVVALLALTLLAAGGLTFVAFPRSGLQAFGHASQDADALPADVSLRGAPRASGADRPLVRVSGLSASVFLRNVYLRAGVYGEWRDGAFHGGAAPLATDAPPAAHRLPPLAYDVRFVSDVLPHAGSLGPIAQARFYVREEPKGLVRDDGTAIARALRSSEPKPVRLSIAGPLWPTPADVPKTPSCQTPVAPPAAMPAQALDPRIAALAARLCPTGTSARDCAQAVRRHLGEVATYSLRPSGAAQSDPLADFLFGGRQGHCEYFATAFAMLLRLRQVPARVVGGFAFGRWDNEAKTIVFTGHHAHAWIEWWDPCLGWVQDDATPPQQSEVLGPLGEWTERWRRFWDDAVLGYSADDQMRFLQGVQARLSRWQAPWRAWRWPNGGSRVWGLASASAALAALAIGFVLWRPPSKRWEERMQAALQKSLQALGGPPMARAQTLQAAWRALPADADPAQKSALGELLDAYEALRFGPAQADAAAQRRLLLQRAHRLAAALAGRARPS